MQAGALEEFVDSAGGVGEKRRERKGNCAVGEPGLVKRDGFYLEVRVGKVLGQMGVGEETVDASGQCVRGACTSRLYRKVSGG